MGLLSIFKRRADASASGAVPLGDGGDAVQRARTRARQRLIGAVVLVGIGIIGFPLVFETQPRPIPVDIPIEIPRKDGAPALVMPAGRATTPTPAASRGSTAPAALPVPEPAPSDVITESRDEAGREVPAAGTATNGKTASAPANAKPASAAAKLAARAASAPSNPPVAVASADASTSKPVAEPKPSVDDAARAKALLDGKAAPVPAPDAAGRFVVQVGAFADASAAHDTRLKAEKLGLKTYTQVASTPAGDRIRVRVGPFSSRDDADKALAKARSAGLSAVVLSL